MKVALNCRAAAGPWGGGNRFIKSIVGALLEAGHTPTERLETDTDAVVIIDPRPRNPSLTFTTGAVLRHLVRRPRTVVVHRINECDERKDTRTMNLRLRLANYAADHTVFIADWLRNLTVWRRESTSCVIRNGADAATFNPVGFKPWNGGEPLRLVTHHWGAHERKGFDVYRRLDALIAEPRWRGRVAFTYIGNAPPNAGLVNTSLRQSLDGDALADALRDHHGYMTASVNEPAGMHHIEGAMCGLPLLYRRSGALPEYAEGFGVAFDGPDDIESALESYMADYPVLSSRMPAYPYTAARMCAAWIALLEDLVRRRGQIAAGRRLTRDPFALVLNQIPV